MTEIVEVTPQDAQKEREEIQQQIDAVAPIMEEIEALEEKIYFNKTHEKRDDDIVYLLDLKKSIESAPIFQIILLNGDTRLFQRSKISALRAKVAKWLQTISLRVSLVTVEGNAINDTTNFDDMKIVILNAMKIESDWDVVPVFQSLVNHLEIGDTNVNQRILPICPEQVLVQARVNVWFFTMSRGTVEWVDTLIEWNVDPSVLQRDHSDCLMVASAYGHPAMVSFLLEKQCDPLKGDRDGAHAIMKASEQGHANVVQVLLNLECNPQKLDRNKYDAIMKASDNGHTAVVKLLLDAACDPHQADDLGQTALLKGCKNGHVRIVKYLLDVNCDPFKKDMLGEDAFKKAYQWRQDEILNVLKGRE